MQPPYAEAHIPLSQAATRRPLPVSQLSHTVPLQSANTTANVSQSRTQDAMHVALLTGGFDRPYALGLSRALVANALTVDLIASDDLDCPEFHALTGLNFLNLQRSWAPATSPVRKLLATILFYIRLLSYSIAAKPKVFHILWNNKLQAFDRTILMLVYKALGKKILLTAHNVNVGRRDESNTYFNRITLKLQYHLVDHVFVHTQKMSEELTQEFGVKPTSVTVIPFGINNAVQRTALTPNQAKRRLGLDATKKTILFFGNIRPYKGLEYLVEALKLLVSRNGSDYHLIIAGQPVSQYGRYWEDIQRKIVAGQLEARILQRIEYIPDDDTELYFKAADLFVLPYTHVYQSGVLFLGYSFGLPAVATDVGSFGEDIVEGRTGFTCRSRDSIDLCRAIEQYFQSDLYRNLSRRREDIRAFFETSHSWETVARITTQAYADMAAE